MSERRAAVEPRIDYATGERVCAWCEGDLALTTARARFCSHKCRSFFHNTPEKKRARKLRLKASRA